jgi:hypothetical protein
MTAEEEGMTAGTITEVHDQREGTEVLVRKDRIRALGQKAITVAHDPKVEIKVLVRKDRIADPVRITAARDLRVVIAGPVRKVDRIADHDLRGRTTPLVLKGEVSSAVQGPKVEIENNVKKTEALDLKIEVREEMARIEVQGRMGKDPTPSQNSWIVQ